MRSSLRQGWGWLLTRLSTRRVAKLADAAGGLLLAAAGVGSFGLFLGMGGLGPIERAFIYFPQREVRATPADLGLAFEGVSFVTADDVRLHGWFVPGTSSVSLLWFHGNAGNIGHRVPNLQALHRELGVSVFLFDYRGYGQSGGSPTEEGTYRDAEAALAVLRARKEVDLTRIVYYGRSLGAAVAIDLATRQKPYGLIVEGAFTSIPDMARHAYPFLPVWPFLQTRYDSFTKMGQVEAPVLVLHAEKDEVIPLSMGRRVYEAAKGTKAFHAISGAGHNDTVAVGGEGYFAILREFLASLGGPRAE